jgi:osmotically-inducible protein OsmY
MYATASRCLVKLSLVGAALFLLVPAWGQQQPAATQPDNTQMNQRDRQPSEPTADQQKENTTDRDLAKQIRQSFVHDKSLSTYAHNVKVIAQGGKVTLKGPVHSEEEKNALGAKAAEIAGASNVDNQLDVVTK